MWGIAKQSLLHLVPEDLALSWIRAGVSAPVVGIDQYGPEHRRIVDELRNVQGMNTHVWLLMNRVVTTSEEVRDLYTSADSELDKRNVIAHMSAPIDLVVDYARICPQDNDDAVYVLQGRVGMHEAHLMPAWFQHLLKQRGALSFAWDNTVMTGQVTNLITAAKTVSSHAELVAALAHMPAKSLLVEAPAEDRTRLFEVLCEKIAEHHEPDATAAVSAEVENQVDNTLKAFLQFTVNKPDLDREFREVAAEKLPFALPDTRHDIRTGLGAEAVAQSAHVLSEEESGFLDEVLHLLEVPQQGALTEESARRTLELLDDHMFDDDLAMSLSRRVCFDEITHSVVQFLQCATRAQLEQELFEDVSMSFQCWRLVFGHLDDRSMAGLIADLNWTVLNSWVPSLLETLALELTARRTVKSFPKSLQQLWKAAEEGSPERSKCVYAAGPNILVEDGELVDGALEWLDYNSADWTRNSHRWLRDISKDKLIRALELLPREHAMALAAEATYGHGEVSRELLETAYRLNLLPVQAVFNGLSGTRFLAETAAGEIGSDLARWELLLELLSECDTDAKTLLRDLFDVVKAATDD